LSCVGAPRMIWAAWLRYWLAAVVYSQPITVRRSKNELSNTTLCETGIGRGDSARSAVFSIYVYRMRCHQYAYDLQLYYSIRIGKFADLSPVVQWTKDEWRWFLENAPLLNPTKTEAALFGTRQ